MANKENETEGEVATPNIVDDPVFRQEYDKALNQWNLEQETTKRQSEAFSSDGRKDGECRVNYIPNSCLTFLFQALLIAIIVEPVAETKIQART